MTEKWKLLFSQKVVSFISAHRIFFFVISPTETCTDVFDHGMNSDYRIKNIGTIYIHNNIDEVIKENIGWKKITEAIFYLVNKNTAYPRD